MTDPSQAAVPGASVTVRNEATGVAHTQRTTDAGLFAFPSLIAGSYTIQVEAKGFHTARTTGNVLAVNTPLAVNLELVVGELADVVTVEAATEQLQTSNASISNVVTQKAIVNLPLNGRNPLNLLVLEPGVMQRSAGAVGTGVHVNGSRDMSHNVTIDGIEANESSVNNPLNNVFGLNPDNIQEYKVTTSNATAEEGRNSGASVAIATRTGSNDFHATLFHFFRNTVLNASEFYANALGNPKPDMKLNIYGATVSGPVVKDRVHFTFSWGDQKVNFAQPVDQVYGTPSLYTAEARAGIYRYWRADPNNPFRIGSEVITRNSPLLVDPGTGALRQGVRTCSSPSDLGCVASYNFAGADPRGIGLDPVIKGYMDQRPLPNNFSTGDGLNVASYFWNPKVKVRGPSYMGRIDARVSDNHTVWGRYLQANTDTIGGDPNNGRPQLYPGLPPMGEVFRASKNLAVGHRWVVSSRLVNEFTAGVARFGFLFTQGEASPSWPEIAPWASRPGTAATNAFNNFDPGEINTPRSYRVVTTPQILDNLSYVTGSHIVRTGFNFRFYRHNDQRGQPGGINVTPVLTFNRTVRPPSDGFAIPAMDSNDFNRAQGTINDLLGIPARITQTFMGDLQGDAFLPYRTGDSVTLWSQGHRLKQYNFYVQDEWKVRRNVTINAGLRWEVNPPPTEAHGRVYVPDRPVVNSSGLVSFVPAGRWFNRMNWGALGPRLGITWSPDEKTVLRTGYAMAFDTLSSFQVTAVAGRVPGLTTQCAVVAGSAPRNGCAGLPDLRIGEGFPRELTPPTLKPSQFLSPQPQVASTAPFLTVFDPELKAPTVHQWNLTVQRELPGSVMAEAAYVGRRGTRLYRAYDINQIDAAPILPSFRAMQQNLAAHCAPSGANCPSGVSAQPVPLANV
ncbi:MAG TPA: TonB-dependent receptor, partial [Bryobacteraceae bacterium]|nr:TonB-dependent receptor [Bryobacteraceae bacterium]